MYSILIPIFNRDVTELATSLSNALMAMDGSRGEIIFAEDGSTEFLEINSQIALIPGVLYHAFPENVGRAAIRNKLAAMGSGEQLIFLDCDVALPDGNFLKRYSKYTQYDVVCGGHTYPSVSIKGSRLHHNYGKSRECLPLKERRNKPYSSFKTSNFMVKKALFAKVQFDESLSTYGHEDTLFGYALRQMEASIMHINNPVIHVAVEPDEVFLSKSKQALANALYLVKMGKLPKEEIRAVETYYRLKDRAAGRAMLQWLVRSEDFLIEKLLQPKPRLRSFDFLKLAWLRQLDQK